jgi:alkylation response protein AidB-like acyl-CoA dehydrogenase
MASYRAPLREISFVLHDVLNVAQLTDLPGYEEATRELVDGLVDEAARLIEQRIAPLNRAGDEQGCTLRDGEVILPEGYVEAYKLYQEAGWVGLANPVEYNGQGLPYTLSKVVEELLCAGNVGFALYPGLTTGAFDAIEASGTDVLKRLYLPRLGNGEWTGTMCMTEPGAGSDVGAVKTRAIPQEDGSYLVDGGKIFITSGEHGMADNIIHFVLARLPDSPPGVKGLSTFLVPKFMVNADGSLGERNAVRCVSIEHKMGMHGSCTCALQFEGARGWIVGAPNQGIQNMFVMMNLARIMVGFQGLGLCELATQNAIRYAQERKQGRPLGGGSDCAIIEHPDVRRMLLQMKAVTEGGRVMGYETALHVDIARAHPDAAVREAAQDWVDLTTPLTKAFLTDAAFDLGSLAVQVYGGHGYVREHGVEQIVRDAKILALYEGTNGIQAMDLVRRKLMLHNGRLPRQFFHRARGELDGEAPLGFIVKPLREALDALEETTQWLQQRFKDDANDAAFGAVDYLRAFSLTLLGYNWLRMAKAAVRHPDTAYGQTKRATAAYFAARMLPQVASLCASVRSTADEQMKLSADQF